MKSLYTYLISFATISSLLLFSLPAQVHAAPDDLIVEFNPNPLFSESNFLPGDQTNPKTATVTNNTDSSQDIIIEAINVNDPDNLGSAITLTIKEDSTTLFDDTLENFFNGGQIGLSTLAGNGASTVYSFTALFNTRATNALQEKSLGFDLLIGFKGDEGSNGNNEENEEETTTTTTTGGGGGGGGGTAIQGLTIFNEAAVEVGETTATITWFSSFKSTSRVIYDTLQNVFNFSLPPNYGYAFSSPEIDTPANVNGVTFHSVTLTGLTPGTTYYYRAISHASPDTVGTQHSFTTKTSPGGVGGAFDGQEDSSSGSTTPPPGTPPGPQGGTPIAQGSAGQGQGGQQGAGNDQTGTGNTIDTGNSGQGEGEQNGPTEGETEGQEEETTSVLDRLGAFLGSIGFSLDDPLTIIILLILLAIILRYLYKKFVKERK